MRNIEIEKEKLPYCVEVVKYHDSKKKFYDHYYKGNRRK